MVKWYENAVSSIELVYEWQKHFIGMEQIILKENATVFPYSNMFFPQLRRVDMYLSRLSPCN